MDDRCFRVDDLDAILTRADEPDVRAHLQACPACRSLLAEYRAFVAGQQASDPRIAAAEADLQGRIAAITGIERAGVPSAARARPPRWWQVSTWSPRRGAVFAVASTGALIVLAVLWLGRPTSWPGEPLLRGEAAPAPTARAAARLEDGSVHFTWPADPNAGAYRLRILSSELAPLTSIAVVRDTTTTLPGATLAQLERDGSGPLLWDLAPVVEGDTLTASAPLLLPQP